MSTTNRAATSAHHSPAFFELLTRQGALDPEEAGTRRRYRMGGVVIVMLVVGHVWVALQGRTLGYKEEALGRLIHRLDQERVELEDAVARESRPALLASRAVELGMQKPGHGQLRRLGAGAAAGSTPIALAAPSAAGTVAAGTVSASTVSASNVASAIQADAKP